MNPLTWWYWWRGLSKNPIYLREKGGWGKPNPFYETLSRFSPFVIIGAVLFGICAGASNPAMFLGEDALFAFYCFLCLPAILLNTITMFGTLMAPTLTAPAISMEINRGTWDILRMTPQPTRSILLAKLFGALARLRIWPLLFVLSMLQGLLIVCSTTFTGGTSAIFGPVIGVSTAVRPWVEIIFAGFVGMYISTRVSSATFALAASYVVVVILKLFNSSTLWMGIFSLLDLNELILLAGSVIPTILYMIIVTGLWFGLMRQAQKLSYE